jgi:inorganic pyrophosphatase
MSIHDVPAGKHVPQEFNVIIEIPMNADPVKYEIDEELPEGKALQRARPQNATSSQDGDVTVVQRTVRLDPAAGR